jgi:endonuclease III
MSSLHQDCNKLLIIFESIYILIGKKIQQNNFVRIFCMQLPWSPRAIQQLFERLEQVTKNFEEPMSFKIVEEYGNDPFLILISCLLSLRARDVVTYKVSQELFAHARTPQQLVKIPIYQLEKIIHPIGTYKRKALILHTVAAYLISHYHGAVPRDEQALLAIPGVGRKTANLVRGIAFGIPSICVDVHVHKIANELGLVATKTPEQTECALQKLIPKKDWLLINTLFVKVGQNRTRLKKMGISLDGRALKKGT